MCDSSCSSYESLDDDDFSADSPPFYCPPSPPAYYDCYNGDNNGQSHYGTSGCNLYLTPPVQIQICTSTLPPSVFPVPHQDGDADESISSLDSHENNPRDDGSREENQEDCDEFENDNPGNLNNIRLCDRQPKNMSTPWSMRGRYPIALQISPAGVDNSPFCSVSRYSDRISKKIHDDEANKISDLTPHISHEQKPERQVFPDSVQQVDLPMIIKFRKTLYTGIAFDEIPADIGKLPTTTIITVDFEKLFRLENIDLRSRMQWKYKGHRFSYGYQNNKLFLIAGEFFDVIRHPKKIKYFKEMNTSEFDNLLEV